MCYLGPNKAISIIKSILASQTHGTMISYTTDLTICEECRKMWKNKEKIKRGVEDLVTASDELVGYNNKLKEEVEAKE